jgi:hypothetical protein
MAAIRVLVLEVVVPLTEVWAVTHQGVVQAEVQVEEMEEFTSAI